MKFSSMKFFSLILLSLFFIGYSYSHEKLSEHIFYQEYNKLEDIIKNKYIRFITSPSAFDYYIYQGKHKGYQYELAKEFVKYLNKKYTNKKSPLKIQFEMVPVPHGEMIQALRDGRGDIIAANLTITANRKDKILFSKPLRKTKELVITRVENKEETIWKKRMAVRKHTSFFEHIKKWNKKNNDKFLQVDYVNKKLEIENIVELLSYGKYDFALVDEHIYNFFKDIYPTIVLAKNQPFKTKTQISWATRKESNKLMTEINKFIPTIKKGTWLGNIFHNKYFEDLSLIVRSRENGQISNYDSIIKKYAKKYNWDWRLISALCFQESRFNPSIINKWGAIGLFQIKKSTALEPYVNIPNIVGEKNIKNNIHAGVKYLSWLRDVYFKKVKGKNKIRLTLAAYNAGPGAISKARRLAKKMKLNPNVWFRNLELAFIKQRKLEPVKYVSEINKRYTSYILLGY
jgi:membrane-bound lytic murein transglycosylase MltF